LNSDSPPHVSKALGLAAVGCILMTGCCRCSCPFLPLLAFACHHIVLQYRLFHGNFVHCNSKLESKSCKFSIVVTHFRWREMNRSSL
jgi:hypothetical protein